MLHFVILLLAALHAFLALVLSTPIFRFPSHPHRYVTKVLGFVYTVFLVDDSEFSDNAFPQTADGLTKILQF